MENNITIFSNPQFGEIRTAGTAEEPMFCLADICRVLDLTAKGVNQRLSDEVISNYPIQDSLGRTQQAIFVNEDGLYDVILDSRKPEAKAFRKWVTSDVLPSIRKTGGYIATRPDETDEDILSRAILIAQETIRKREARIQLLEEQNKQQTTQLIEQKPKVEYFNETLQSVNTYTTTQVAKQLGMSAEMLNKRLSGAGLIYRQSNTWLLYRPYDACGLHKTRTTTFTRNDGSIGTDFYTVWTEKGRFFITLLHENGYDMKSSVKKMKEVYGA